MIVRLSGKLVEKRDNSLIIVNGGISYEILVPVSVLKRIDSHIDEHGNVEIIIYHYLQVGPSNAFPVFVGFLSEVERDFFLQFIKVSGIGPRAAIKALNGPISEIAHAINESDVTYLKSLPGIGAQKAKEIVAKLQGKVGKFGLIQDTGIAVERPRIKEDWQEEALAVLLQLQYKKNEAVAMIQKALQRAGTITSTEELLTEIYKQRTVS